MKYLSAAVSTLALLGVVACSAETEAAPDQAAAAPAPVETAAPTAAPVPDAELLAQVNAGTYDVEKTHAFLFWKVTHGSGLSTYVVKFKNWDASIEFDPTDVAKSTVTATIDPTSVETDHPTEADEWHEKLATDFFKAEEFPQITFTSTNVELTGPREGKITGDLAFLGVTKPVTLDVTFNGVGNQPWFGERDIIGFDAKTTIKRSEWGLDKYVGGGISDETEIWLSAEFLEREAE